MMLLKKNAFKIHNKKIPHDANDFLTPSEMD